MADLKAFEETSGVVSDDLEIRKVPDPAELAARPVFAKGRAADHPYGVLYQGEFETLWDGTAVAVRRHARALAMQGIPVQLRSFSNTVVNAQGLPDPVHMVGLPDPVLAEVGFLRDTTITEQVPLIKHAILRDAAHARAVIVPRSTLGEPDPMRALVIRRAIAEATILFSVWERDRIGADLVRELGRVGQLWVPCEHNRQMLERSGIAPEKIRVVPHPYDPADPILRCLERPPRAPGWRLFYSIGRWEPRKGYAELIQTFLTAFKPTDKVVLTIKHSGNEWKDYPTPAEAVTRALELQENGWTAENLGPRLRLLSGRAPRETILQLHYENNIYVASSHGEAWNLGAFDAKLAGNRLIYTAHGGTEDFAGPGDMRIDQGLEPVHPSYRWEPDAQWAAYSMDLLGRYMKLALVPERFELPEKFSKFTLAAVGQKMFGHVMQLTAQVQPEAYEYYLKCARPG